jgi:hypothetical protein
LRYLDRVRFLRTQARRTSLLAALNYLAVRMRDNSLVWLTPSCLADIHHIGKRRQIITLHELKTEKLCKYML